MLLLDILLQSLSLSLSEFITLFFNLSNNHCEALHYNCH